ncbi:histidine phosphatase family protein [Thalassococcus sp. S3]|uniref:SixA phosphatase family protein n=1 Tax=Thalassococcus sp. S3 TaxID=2017482 RepID=UPI001023FBBB|nr:histidine phosphatase family protein [Thalassococcus sp. S3]QBF30146.1 phosphoglycerate mutase [Thalassococcus sp. S3]
MTKTLILMRHAKSSWKDADLPDRDRPLNKRGRKSASALGRWMRTQGIQPGEVLCSRAQRTEETCMRLEIGLMPRLLEELYHASPEQMLRMLKTADGEAVLMVGHNPGIAGFANALVSAWPDHERFLDYPTGATTVMEFDIESWSDIQPGTGRVRSFVVPRELPDM